MGTVNTQENIWKKNVYIFFLACQNTERGYPQIPLHTAATARWVQQQCEALWTSCQIIFYQVRHEIISGNGTN